LIFKVTGQGHGVTFLGEKIRHALHWFILINPEDISEHIQGVKPLLVSKYIGL
jgi:hypothetical protein